MLKDWNGQGYFLLLKRRVADTVRPFRIPKLVLGRVLWDYDPVRRAGRGRVEPSTLKANLVVSGTFPSTPFTWRVDSGMTFLVNLSRLLQAILGPNY